MSAEKRGDGGRFSPRGRRSTSGQRLTSGNPIVGVASIATWRSASGRHPPLVPYGRASGRHLRLGADGRQFHGRFVRRRLLGRPPSTPLRGQRTRPRVRVRLGDTAGGCRKVSRVVGIVYHIRRVRGPNGKRSRVGSPPAGVSNRYTISHRRTRSAPLASSLTRLAAIVRVLRRICDLLDLSAANLVVVGLDVPVTDALRLRLRRAM